MSRITGKHITLVPFDAGHLQDPAYLAWLNDIEVTRYLGRNEYLKPVGFETVREYVEALWQSPYCHFFAVLHKDGDVFIGTAKVNFISQSGLTHRIADVGIMIGRKDYWGKGLATDTLGTVSRHAFEVLGARKLSAGGIDRNIGVVKAFKNIGFVEEGRIRKSIFLSGEYLDHVLLGCFPDELKAS